MPSIDAPGSPRAFIPTSWNGSSTRALMPAGVAPPSKSSRSTGVQNSSVGGLQADLPGRLGGDVEGRGPGVDQEVERPLAVDPDPDQEVVRVGQPVGDPVRPADLRVGPAPAGRPGPGPPGSATRPSRPSRVSLRFMECVSPSSRSADPGCAVAGSLPGRLSPISAKGRSTAISTAPAGRIRRNMTGSGEGLPARRAGGTSATVHDPAPRYPRPRSIRDRPDRPTRPAQRAPLHVDLPADRAGPRPDQGVPPAPAAAVPLLLIAYVDRANVAIAKLTMTQDLPAFDDAVIGFGDGDASSSATSCWRSPAR